MRRIVVLVVASALTLGWISGCGGQSSSTEPDGAGGSGGTSGNGGASGSGGKPLNVDCFFGPDTGPCNAAFPRYAFHERDRVCHPFIYGGCEGNGNNFESVAECQAACVADYRIDFTRCTTSDECVVATPGCCGACEPLDFYRFVAVNAAHLDEFGLLTCEPGTVCGGCQDYPGPLTRPWFGAKCEAGHCVLFDAHIAASCTTPSDCHLRAGAACCEACGEVGPDTLVAISSLETLRAEVCSPDTACATCDPNYPPGAEADCIDGLCAVDLNLR